MSTTTSNINTTNSSSSEAAAAAPAPPPQKKKENGEKAPSPPGEAGDAPKQAPKTDGGDRGGNNRRNSNNAARRDSQGAGGGGRGGGGGRRPSFKEQENGRGGSAGGGANKNGSSSENGGAFQQVRTRRRTSTKGGEDDKNSAGGDKNWRVSQSGGGSNGGNGGGRKKEWSERKSFSQQNNQQHRERNNTNSTAEDPRDFRRTKSTNSSAVPGGGGNKNRQPPRQSTTSVNSNGDGLDYGNYDDLDEPFSDSESECSRPRGPTKKQLPITRGRIRTLSGTVPVVGFSPKWGGPTMCLSCLHFFDLPEQLEEFAGHLLTEHHIVVSEMELIVDPKRYIEHWRQRFAKESIDNIFPRVEPIEGDVLFGKSEYYYEMSARALPEDFQLRQRLAMRRLEEALSCQQREREDANFSQQCIFCRYTARGNRSKIIHHLYMIHHLNLGSPDNLVFVTEYIEHLKEKLVRNECIYCEKTFADRNTLMDHMRKRNHREVNPKNHYYDKFYIINYLELGKRWLDVLAEDFEDQMPTFADSDEEEEEDSWCEWQEDNVDADETRVLCLCCEESVDNIKDLLTHMKEKHSLDLLEQMEKAGIAATYDRAKLINYIRKQNFNSTCWVCGKAELGNWMAVYRHIDENHKPVPALPERSAWDTEEDLVGLFGNDHLIWMLESHLDTLAGEGAEEEEAKGFDALVAASKQNTVEGVIAEDLPDLPELEDLDQIF